MYEWPKKYFYEYQCILETNSLLQGESTCLISVHNPIHHCIGSILGKVNDTNSLNRLLWNCQAFLKTMFYVVTQLLFAKISFLSKLDYSNTQ